MSLSILRQISKVFQKVLSQQTENVASNILSPKHYGFKKNHWTHNALQNLMKICKRCLDKSGVAGIVLMGLSKAYDCLPHKLLLTRHSTYSF